MNRRGFLSALACLPGLAFLKPEEEDSLSKIEPIQYLRGDPLWDFTKEGDAWRQAVTEAANDKWLQVPIEFRVGNGPDARSRPN